MSSSDVVVIGGGLVGLALVCALRDSGLGVTLIERQSAPTASVVSLAQESDEANMALDATPQRTGAQLISGISPRVSALNKKSRAFLSRIGGWPKSDDRMSDYLQMAVWDAQGTGSISFTAADIQQDCLGTIVENAAVVTQLYASASDIDNLELIFDMTLKSIEKSTNGYSICLSDGREIDCELLVGADGGQSRVKKLAGLSSIDWSYHQSAVVTTVEVEKPHGKIARQWFTDQGPLAFLPLANPNLCSIVWSSKNADQLLELDEQGFCDQLSQVSAKEFGSVLACDKRFSFPLTQRHAVQYAKENLVLIGDAAHTIHPLAGQGVNLGFADAQTLAQILSQCRFESRSPGDLKILKQYENRRKPENLLMAAVMEGFKHLFGSEDPGVRWLRNASLRLVDTTDVLKTMVAKLAAGS